MTTRTGTTADRSRPWVVAAAFGVLLLALFTIHTTPATQAAGSPESPATASAADVETASVVVFDDAGENDPGFDCGGVMALCAMLILALGVRLMTHRGPLHRVLWSTPPPHTLVLGTVAPAACHLTPRQQTSIARC